MSAIEIVALDDRLWDSAIGRFAGENLFHRPAWTRCLTRHFPLVSFEGRAAIRDGGVAGIAPAVRIASPFGAFVSALPGAHIAPPLGSDDSAVGALVEGLRERADGSGANYLEIRARADDPAIAGGNSSFEHATWVTRLARDEEDLLARYHADTRWQIRRAARRRLRVRQTRDPGAFLPLYETAMAGFGTPPLPRAFLEELIEREEELRIIEVESSGRVVSAILARISSRSSHSLLAANSVEGRFAKAGAFALHHAFLAAAEQGAGEFDLGRSRPGGSHARFKESFGAERIPLAMSYPFIRGGRPSKNPDAFAMKFAAAAMKLAPLAVLKKLSPLLPLVM